VRLGLAEIDHRFAGAGTDDAGNEKIGVAGEGVEPDRLGLEIGAAAPTGAGETQGEAIAGPGGDAVDEVGGLADADTADNVEVIAGEGGEREGVKAALVGPPDQRRPTSSSRPWRLAS
jgi:hypothetical protein